MSEPPPPGLKSIDHLGIVVESLGDATRLWCEELGLEFTHDEDTPYGRLRFLRCGELQIELIEPTPGSPLARWREREGDGLHHIAFAVDDADAALVKLGDIDSKWCDEAAAGGSRGTRIAFLNPGRAGAPVIEIVQHPAA